jgi:hypothetical protein
LSTRLFAAGNRAVIVSHAANIGRVPDLCRGFAQIRA